MDNSEITAETLARWVFQRPDLTDDDREKFFTALKKGDEEMIVRWDDFLLMADKIRQFGRPS